jgi:pilus assembly protein Flp/PilA
MIIRFLRDESGVTSIEYGLIAVLLSIAVISGASLIGQSLDGSFTNTADQVAAVVP